MYSVQHLEQKDFVFLDFFFLIFCSGGYTQHDKEITRIRKKGLINN